MQLTRPVGRDDDRWRLLRADGAELGDGDLKVREQLEQVALELFVRAVELVDEQHWRLGPVIRQGLEQRPLDQEPLAEQFAGRLLPIHFARCLHQADFKQLPGVVPLVHRLADIQALVALQTDQLGVQRGRQHFSHFSLADAGLALEEQGPPELQGEKDGCREPAIGNVVVTLEECLDVVDGGWRHQRHERHERCRGATVPGC